MRTIQHLQILAEASRVFAAASLNLPDVVRTVARYLGATLGDACAIRLLSEDGHWLTIEEFYHPDPEACELLQQLASSFSQPAEVGWSGQALRSGEPLLVSGITIDQLQALLRPEYWPYLERFPVHSCMVAPLRVEGAPIGTVLMARGSIPDPYTRDDLILLQELADRIALTIDHAKLHHSLQEAERRKDEALALLETFLASAPVGLALVDRDLRYVRINETLARIHGRSAEQYIGRTLAEVIPDILPTVEPFYRHVLERGEAITNQELSVAHPDRPGEERRWAVNYYPVRTDEGQILGVGVIVQDITEQKRLRASEERARIAEEASRAKTEFLSRMSHELRTPLNAVLGFTQLLEMDESLLPRHRESVEHILRGGEHLLELINEVLDISRAEAGRLALEMAPVPVGEVVREALELVWPIADRHSIQLAVKMTNNCTWEALADRQRLKQVMLNLLSNAIKHNRAGGIVSIRCALASERIRISIDDTGPGIAPEAQQKLFQPFERLNADERGVEGSGLGLLLCKQLVTLMGGTIGIESAPGVGSSFWVELPSATEPADQPEEEYAEPLQPNRSAHDATILYMEDNPLDFKLLKLVLRDRPDVLILLALQGQIGLELAQEHRPDLIVLDLNLPDMPGLEVFRRLKEHPRTRAIPVVILSAENTLSQRGRLLAEGARDYFTKPLDTARFLVMVDEILGERSSGG